MCFTQYPGQRKSKMEYLNTLLACIEAYPNIWGLDKIALYESPGLDIADFPRNIASIHASAYVPCLATRLADYEGWRALFRLTNGLFVFLEAAGDDFVGLAESWGSSVKPNRYFDKALKVVCSEGEPLYGYRHHVPEIRLRVAADLEQLLRAIEFRSFDTPWDTIWGVTEKHERIFRSGRARPVDVGRMLEAGHLQIQKKRAALEALEEQRKAAAAAAAAAAKAEEDRKAHRYDLSTFLSATAAAAAAPKQKKRKQAWDLSQLD